MPAVRGRRSLWRLLDFLDKLEPAGPSDLAQSLRTFSIKCSGKGIVVVLSDFMDKGGYEEALRYLDRPADGRLRRSRFSRRKRSSRT